MTNLASAGACSQTELDGIGGGQGLAILCNLDRRPDHTNVFAIQEPEGQIRRVLAGGLPHPYRGVAFRIGLKTGTIRREYIQRVIRDRIFGVRVQQPGTNKRVLFNVATRTLALEISREDG